MKKPKSILPLLMLLLSITVFAEKPPVKFGKVSKEEIEMKVYTQDSSASAVVLYDYCTVKIEYVQDQGFKQKITRNLRIKILKKEGYNWAKLEIDLKKNMMTYRA